MTTVIFYDLEAIDLDDLRRIRRQAGSDLLEIAPASTVWPEADLGEGDGPLRVSDPRSEDFLDHLMSWFDQVFPSANSSSPLDPAGELLETARYALLFDLAHPVHRWSCLLDLLARHAPKSLVWVTDDSAGSAPTEISDLLSSVPQLHPKWMRVKRPGLLGRWRLAARQRINRHWYVIERWRILIRALGNRYRSRKLEPSSVVITEYFPNSVKASLPVAKELEARGTSVLWLPARKRVEAKLHDLDVGHNVLLEETLTLKGVWRRRSRQSEREALDRLLLLAQKPLPVCTHPALTAGPPLARYELKLSHLLRRRAVPLLSQATHWLALYSDAWERLQPRLVLSTTYSSIQGRAAARSIRHRQGFSAYLQHGAFPARRVYSYFCHDLILVWGEHERQSLESFGVPGERLRAVGATLYDEALREKWDEREDLLPKPGGPLRLALMASRSGGAVSSLAVSRKTLELVARAARRVPSARLVVKVHPADSTTLPEEVLAAYPEAKLVRDGSSQDVIRSSDVVIVASSTTGYEACVFGRPLILFNLTGRGDFVDYAALGAALRAQDEDDLVRFLSRLQTDEELLARLREGRRRLFEELLAGGRGDSAEQAARVIAEAVQAAPPTIGPKTGDQVW